MDEPKSQNRYLTYLSLGQHLDLSNAPRMNTHANLLNGTQVNRNENEAQDNRQREFLGINFECCRIYSRIFINDEKDKFLGNCPRCGKYVQFDISPDGTDARFFDVY